MSVSSFLAGLILPVNLCVVLLIIAVTLWFIRWRKLATLIAGAGILWVVFWSLPASSLWAGGRLEQMYPYKTPTSLPVTQAIVVLGGSTANGRHNWFEPYDNERARARVDAAAELYKAGRAPKVVVSGAALEGSVSESQIMANALRQQGVPESAIVQESNSLTTYENALYTARELEKMGIHSVILVTSALHMPRSMGVFKRQGIDPIAAPATPQITVPDDPHFAFWQPDLRTLDASRSIIKEYAGMLVYWLRGWL